MSSRKKRNRTGAGAWWRSPRLGGLLHLALAVYAAIALGGPAASWWSLANGEPGASPVLPGNPGGPVGALVALAVRTMLGDLWCWALPALLALRGLGLLVRGEASRLFLASRLIPLWLASAVWLGQSGWPLAAPQAAAWGGAPGYGLARGFTALFGRWGAGIFLSFLLLTAVLRATHPWLPSLLGRLGPLGAALGAGLAAAWRGFAWLLLLPWRLVRGIGGTWRGAAATARDEAGRRAVEPAPAPAGVAAAPPRTVQAAASTAAAPPRVVHVPPDHERNAVADFDEEDGPPAPAGRRASAPGSPESFPEVTSGLVDPAVPLPLPDLSVLREPPTDRVAVAEEQLHAAADLLEETLRSFGVEGAVKDVRPGPVVTTYEYQPASGIKVNAIVQRSDDLALAMKARSIRMEAPIPGKAAVGIEIPNPTQQIVSMKEVYVQAADRMRTPLSVVLGRDVFGEAVTIDLADQPHLLVAGSTGSGKSVCVNAMISSLLLRCDPSLVRLLLIDPKMLELNVYNDIPHLLLPVVTDPKDALRALKWMEAQMDHRYRRLSRHSVRNIEGYNRKVAAGEIAGDDGVAVSEPMPYYVCIVDELADLMIQLGQEIEMPITRIAQKARAVGIHLVLATQRPSVDVLTGVIKANIPCRIAFRVIQKNDSRTILDANGAEKLLGKGDMLYLQPGRATPVRVHGAFIDIEECEALAAHWRQFKDVTRPITLDEEREEATGLDLEDDPLFEKAREIIVLSQHGSTSMLQRKLQIGYARAGRLMDLLEQAGVVGPFIGSKAREVVMKPDDLSALREFEQDSLT
ncbi:MAG: DNA translocase FtsK [Candidatus Latescibacteria bacterium]|nr:DNA translocase FtsK [Candidatus Latescibacterota bacterium]